MEKALTVTPNKIQRLIHIAEDNSYRKQDEDSRRIHGYQYPGMHGESSSGLLDLDNMDILEAMTESESDNNFLTVSTAFNPGEMTGRSTGAEEVMNKSMPLGRHSVAINAITSQMDKQSHEVNNLLRHSIGNTTTYSFQSKRDLTADEASLMMREAPLPVQPSAQAQFPDSYGTNSSALSVGAYFQKRCSGFEAVLGKTDSPERSMYSMPSISEVTPKKNYMDESLDSVPVRQSRLELPEKLNLNNPTIPKNYEKQTFQTTRDKHEKNHLLNKTFNRATGPDYSSISNAPEPHLDLPRPLNPIASSSFANVSQAFSSQPTESSFANFRQPIPSNPTESSSFANFRQPIPSNPTESSSFANFRQPIPSNPTESSSFANFRQPIPSNPTESSSFANFRQPIPSNPTESSSFANFRQPIPSNPTESSSFANFRQPIPSNPTESSFANFRQHIPSNPTESSSFANVRQALSCKPTDVLIRNMQAALRLTSEETEESACPDNSISISKIADYLGKESNVSVSAMLQYNNRKKSSAKKQTSSQLHMNFKEDKSSDGTQVTRLSETRKLDTASSAGTVSTVVLADRLKDTQDAAHEHIPAIVVSNSSIIEQVESRNTRRSTRSKSPSSKSPSTLSTVQENYNSFKSGDSPLQTSKGEVINTRVPSPNIEYRELDKSVDWHEVLQQKRRKQQSLAKEQWADIVTSASSGFVGVSCAVNCTITTLTDSWLFAKLKFDVPSEDINIEPPKLPLLSPGKTEKFTFYITSNIELDTSISYTMCLKDEDREIEQKGSFDVQIKMPTIQAMSTDEINKLTFPPIQEMCSLFKSFVLVSDCSADLQLELFITEGAKVYSISNVQEIVKSDVNKALMEKQVTVEEMQLGKAKSKGMNKQLCRLSNGNAIRVTVNFIAPKLSELQTEESIATFTGALNVNLIGVNTVLRKVDLVGTVGTVNLVIKVPENKLHLTSEPTILTLSNTGSVNGVWVVKAAKSSTDSFPFKVAPAKFDIRPGSSKDISLSYTGPEDSETLATLVFEDLITYQKTAIKISGGSDTPKSFPIKTNYGTLSFVRPGRMDINLKNTTNKKIHIRMMIHGDGFSIDVPGLQTGEVYCMPFGPSECRTLTIVFDPASNIPYAANLHLVYDKNCDISRNVRLFGCSSGSALRWAGLVTYNEMALVRAASRQPVRLDLYNRNAAPAFLAAKPHFHLQYNAVESTAQLVGNQRVVSGRTRHALSLVVDWSRVERCARNADTGAFATVTVLTGAEITRRRILKVIRDESSGVLDTSLLADHLKVLADPYEGEDPNIDNMLTEFKETKDCLTELIGGLQQLTAQVVLSSDYDNTIVITDDTVVEHHTLCD